MMEWLREDLADRDHVMAAVALGAYVVCLSLVGTVQITTALVRFGWRSIKDRK